MGSFTSMPKVIPAAESEDADACYPRGREDLTQFLARCSRNLGSLPPPIERKWRRERRSSGGGGSDSRVESEDSEKVRVLQWNVLSQGECAGGVIVR